MLTLIVWGTEEHVKNRNMYSLYTDKTNKIFGLRMKLKYYQKIDRKKEWSTNREERNSASRAVDKRKNLWKQIYNERK